MTDSEKLEALEEVLRDDITYNTKVVKTIKRLEMLIHIALGLSSLSFGMLIGLLCRISF